MFEDSPGDLHYQTNPFRRLIAWAEATGKPDEAKGWRIEKAGPSAAPAPKLEAIRP